MPILEDHHLKAIFRKTFRPLYLHYWVATWVFDNITSSPFHNNYPLSTQVFNQLILISIRTRFQCSYVSTILQDKCEGHDAFIPIYTENNITVGYSICFASDYKDHVKSAVRIPFAPPFIARFVLDHNTNDLIIFVPCLSHNCIAIHNFHLTNSTQHTIIIPAKEYNWYSLPQNPLAVFESSTYSPSTQDVHTNFQTFINQKSHMRPHNKTDLTHDDVLDLMSHMSISSHSSTALQHQHQPISNFQYQINPGRNRTSSHLLSIEEQLTFRTLMINMFHNRATSVGEKIDSGAYQLPGYDTAVQIPRLHHTFHLAKDQFSNFITPKCAYVYYSFALSVTTDLPLLKPSAPTTTAQTQFTQSSLQVNDDQNPLTDFGQKVEKKTRDVVLKERKMRNRLSAARSYARKQERIEEMERELHASKHIIKELQKTHIEKYQYNQQLKMMVCLKNK